MSQIKDAEPAEDPKVLRVKHYNPEAETLRTRLGLTDNTRLDRILKDAHTIFNSEDNSEAIAKVSNMVESANELAYVMYIMGDSYSIED
jgi:hypothetical protein